MSFIEFLWEWPFLMLLATIISGMTFFMGKSPFNRLTQREQKVVAIILLFFVIWMLAEAIVFFTLYLPDVLDTVENVEKEISNLRYEIQRRGWKNSSYKISEIGELNERIIEIWTMTNFISLFATIFMILNLFAFLNCWVLIFRSKYFKLNGAKLRKSLWE